MELWRTVSESRSYEMIKYATSFGLEVCSSTNGYPFYKHETIEKLIDSGLDTLIVGIDGVSQSTHSKYRVGTDLQKIINGLYEFRGIMLKRNLNKPKIIIQTLAFSFNEHEVDQIKSMAHDLDAEFRIKSANLDMVNGERKDKAKSLPSNPALPIRYDIHENYKLRRTYHNYCPKVWKELTINADGLVSPCCYDYHGTVILGDVTRQTIYEIWSGDAMQQFRRKILNRQDTIPICKDCPVALVETEHYKIRIDKE